MTSPKLPSPFGIGAIYLALAAPPLRRALESNLAAHMAVQLPLLAGLGWAFAAVIAKPSQRLCDSVNRAGASGLAFALITFAYWMLPVSIDSAVQDGAADALKFVTLPLGGLALGLSWPRLSALVRGILKANAISMLLFLSWLYAASPQRLCNSYLRTNQDQLSLAALTLALLLSIRWCAPLFWSEHEVKIGNRNPAVLMPH